MRQLNDTKKEMIFSELNSLLGAGLDFSHAFTLLIESENDKEIKKLLDRIYQSVIGGNTLWKALKQTESFTPLDYGVVSIGEETGKLCDALQFLANYYQGCVSQRRMITGAVSYPLIIIATAFIVLVFMIAVIVPMFEQVYARMGGEMPAVTQLIIALSRNFHIYVIVFIMMILSIVLFLHFYGKQDHIRAITSRLLLHTPMVGMFLKKSTQARFCKLLFLLYSSGVPLIRGIAMLREIITFHPYQHSFDEICEGLNRGKGVAETMDKFEKIYDRKLVVLIKVGEQTNRLGAMLQKQGADITTELEHKLKQVGATLEPILIMFVGAIVAVILIAMYMPMFKMGSVIQ